MAIVAIVNLRGVGESVKANVVLTCVELTGLLIIITIGMMAIAAGQGDVSRVMQFKTTADGGMFWPVSRMPSHEKKSTSPQRSRAPPSMSRCA